MDWLADPYSVMANIYDDPNAEPVEITWYFALPGAKRFPGHHAFGSMVWQSDTREYPTSTPGEKDLIRFKPNARVVKESGQGPIATPMSWFLNGAPTSFVPRDCCGQAIPRGAGELDGPGLWGWFANKRDWRNVGLTERGGANVRSWDREGAVRELGGPQVNPIPVWGVAGELGAPSGILAGGVAELDEAAILSAGGVAELSGPGAYVVVGLGELSGPGGFDGGGVAELAAANGDTLEGGGVAELAGEEVRKQADGPGELADPGYRCVTALDWPDDLFISVEDVGDFTLSKVNDTLWASADYLDFCFAGVVEHWELRLEDCLGILVSIETSPISGDSMTYEAELDGTSYPPLTFTLTGQLTPCSVPDEIIVTDTP